MRLADAPGDELRVLRSEVDDQDGTGGIRAHGHMLPARADLPSAAPGTGAAGGTRQGLGAAGKTPQGPGVAGRTRHAGGDAAPPSSAVGDNAPMGRSEWNGRARGRARRRTSLPDLVLRGRDRRAPDGRRLTKPERRSLPVLSAIDDAVVTAMGAVGEQALCTDVEWLLLQFHNPLELAQRKSPKLPARDLLQRAVDFLERRHDLLTAPDGAARVAGTDAAKVTGSASTPARRRAALADAVDVWYDAMSARRHDPRWRDVEGTPVTMATFRGWQDRLAAMDLEVIPTLRLPAEFDRALRMVQEWDELLHRRGHTGERFSLREEVVRLHNWPGDQWNSGDDYASAQKRFHRRLSKARRLSTDPVRDRIMVRALYLREGLLLNPVEDLEWFLAVLQFRWMVPEMLDVRPDLVSWRLLDWIARIGRGNPTRAYDDPPSWIDAADPRGVPRDLLTGVGGPGVMIDLDEDVVTALPPGCRVRRVVMGARGPLGPDWTVYWVESEWGDSRPILDLVESAKLHPAVVFVSDGEPDDLAEVVRPFLDLAFEIPTNPLTAHSHGPGVIPRIPEHPDAGLS